MTKKINQNLIKIVNILNDGHYHAGNIIGEQLNLTRAGVWKAIKQLESYGVEIISIKGKGYALRQPLILLDENAIKQHLANEKIDIILFNKIGSTNEYLKKINKDKKVKICLAEMQTHGKGRLSRVWYSPFAKNIYFSCLFPFQKDVSELAGLSLICALAVMKTLEDIGIRDHLRVKWPNDITYDNKKLSGILVEMQAESHGICHVIIGIAINVNMLGDENHHISQAWTSLQKITNRYIDRNNLAGQLTNHLIDYLNRFDQQGFTPFIDEWTKKDCLINQIITVKNVNDKIEGRVTGINMQGHLLLQLHDGSIRAFSSGDTSIVKKDHESMQ